MLSLEMLGCYSDEPGTQKYPSLFSLFYPSTGNFIGFVGNFASRKLVRQCITAFRRHVDFPSEGAALPESIPAVGWSDHWSFWQVGYPALMVTDTAFLRNANYHQPGDTPDTLDYERMARLVLSLRDLINHLASAQCLKGGVRSPT